MRAKSNTLVVNVGGRVLKGRSLQHSGREMHNIAFHPTGTEYKMMWSVSSASAERESETEIMRFF